MRLLLLALFLVSPNVAAVFRVQLELVERTNMNSTAYGEILPGAFGLRLNNCGDIEYFGSVVIGSPEREFRVVFDTGSTEFWVMGNQCRVGHRNGRQCTHHRLYNRQSSDSFRNHSGKFRIDYESGFSEGGYAMDTVALGSIQSNGVRTPNLVFGVADTIDRDSQADVIDGVMGLGFPESDRPQSLINRAFAEGTLERPMYTIWMDKVGGERQRPGGEILFGDVDRQRCHANVHWVPLKSTDYWQFHLGKVVAKGKMIVANVPAVSDTGTSSLLIPRRFYRKFMKSIGLPANTGALPYVPCKMQFLIHFFINGRQFVLAAQELMVRYSDGCVLEVEPTSFDNSWVLGDPFIRAFCQVYDLGQRRLGFSRALPPKNWRRNRVIECGKKCQNSRRLRPLWIRSLRSNVTDVADDDSAPWPEYPELDEE